VEFVTCKRLASFSKDDKASRATSMAQMQGVALAKRRAESFGRLKRVVYSTNGQKREEELGSQITPLGRTLAFAAAERGIR
jgi:hypothetical protein